MYNIIYEKILNREVNIALSELRELDKINKVEENIKQNIKMIGYESPYFTTEENTDTVILPINKISYI